MKMVAKKPEDRFADLGEVIKALESFPRAPGRPGRSPRGRSTPICWRRASGRSTPPRRLQAPCTVLLPLGLGLCALLVLFTLMIHKPAAAGAFLGLGLMTSLAYFVVRGFRDKTPTFLKVTGAGG